MSGAKCRLVRESSASRRELVAIALASGKTVREAAADAKASERVVYKWLLEDAFKNRVRELRNAAMSAASGKLQSSMTKAADTLVALLESPNPAIRLRAATALLSSGLDAGVIDLTDTIEEIKRRLNESDEDLR